MAAIDASIAGTTSRITASSIAPMQPMRKVGSGVSWPRNMAKPRCRISSKSALGVIVRVGRLIKRRDHGRRGLVAQIRLEAKRAQAVHQAAPVTPHPLETRRLALLGVLAQRRDQRRGGLGRRREAPAPVVLEAAPLPMQIQAERVRAAGRRLERSALHQHQADARHAFEPFVGRSDDGLRDRAPRHRSAGRRTRRSHPRSGRRPPSGHLGQRLDGIEQTGAGVDVADRDVADGSVGRERRIELLAASPAPSTAARAPRTARRWLAAISFRRAP